MGHFHHYLEISSYSPSKTLSMKTFQNYGVNTASGWILLNLSIFWFLLLICKVPPYFENQIGFSIWQHPSFRYCAGMKKKLLQATNFAKYLRNPLMRYSANSLVCRRVKSFLKQRQTMYCVLLKAWHQCLEQNKFQTLSCKAIEKNCSRTQHV